MQLTEFLAAGDDILDGTGQTKRQLHVDNTEVGTKPKAVASCKQMLQSGNSGGDGLTILVKEGLRNGQQILVFCSSRNACQTVCKHLSAAIVSVPTNGDSSDLSPVRHQGSRLSGESLTLGRLAIADIISSSVSCGQGGEDGILTTLCAGIRVGVAFAARVQQGNGEEQCAGQHSTEGRHSEGEAG